MNMIKKIKKTQNIFEKQFEKYFFHHPYMGFFFMLVGISTLILFAVTICTIVIMLPISCIMGWL